MSRTIKRDFLKTASAASSFFCARSHSVFYPEGCPGERCSPENEFAPLPPEVSNRSPGAEILDKTLRILLGARESFVASQSEKREMNRWKNEVDELVCPSSCHGEFGIRRSIGVVVDRSTREHRWSDRSLPWEWTQVGSIALESDIQCCTRSFWSLSEFWPIRDQRFYSPRTMDRCVEPAHRPFTHLICLGFPKIREEFTRFAHVTSMIVVLGRFFSSTGKTTWTAGCAADVLLRCIEASELIHLEKRVLKDKTSRRRVDAGIGWAFERVKIEGGTVDTKHRSLCWISLTGKTFFSARKSFSSFVQVRENQAFLVQNKTTTGEEFK